HRAYLFAAPPPPPRSPLFPYTTLFRSRLRRDRAHAGLGLRRRLRTTHRLTPRKEAPTTELRDAAQPTTTRSSARPTHDDEKGALDRKSTRLNSSHVKISYAVFCLKKKK